MTPKEFSLSLLAGAMVLGAGAAQSMDLLQAFEAARAQDASILTSRAAADAGRERMPQARAQLLPNLSISAGRTRNKLESTAPNFLGEEKTSNSDYFSSNQTLQLRQPLYRPYQAAALRQAQSQVDDVNAVLERDEQNLAARVSGAYFEALLTGEQLALVTAQKAFYTTQLDAARKLFAGGAGIRTDIDEAQARLDLTMAQELEARQNAEYTRMQLQSLVNQPVSELAPLDPSRLSLDVSTLGDVSVWKERAEQSNAELRSLSAQLAATRQEIDKSRAGHKPTLDAVAQWSRSASENVTQPTTRYVNGSVGIQLNIPLYSGGYVNSTMRQAVAEVARAEQALEAGRREVGIRVFREYRNVTESVPKIQALEQAVRSADQLVVSSRKSFQAGSRTLVDILNAEQQRSLAQRDLAQARYIYLISKIRLLALVGGADVAAITEINSNLKH